MLIDFVCAQEKKLQFFVQSAYLQEFAESRTYLLSIYFRGKQRLQTGHEI